MANRQNIQMLFDEMTIKHVTVYMQNKGWVLSESQNPEVTAFEFERGDENKRIWIWSAPSNPKFRSRLQNLVFSLAVQNGIEPLEIANEIADTEIPAETQSPNSNESPDSSDQKADQFEVVLQNDTGATTELILAGVWTNACSLSAGDKVRVIGESLTECPEISFGADRITMSSVSPERIRVFCIGSTAARDPSDHACIRHTIEAAFEKYEIDAAESLVKKLGPALERAAFELNDVNRSPGFERFVLKSVAVLLVAIAELFPDSDGDKSHVLWFVCSQVVSNLHLAVELFPGCQELLWHSVKSDEPTSPNATFSWLTDRVIVRN